jgi:hypothetical protein
VAFEDGNIFLRTATLMTGLFVVVMGNGWLSQNINDCLEARANGRGLFRSLNPSTINFPLQVQWIDGGHWTLRSFKRPDLISHKSSISSAPNEGDTTGQPGTEGQVPQTLLSPAPRVPDENRA